MKPYAHHACFLAVALGFALLPSALVAAITDADLAKVTQLIQEGKTARAKAEITILLDENPNDPSAPKLRRLMESLGAPAESASGPTAKETLEWIQSHMGSLGSKESDYVSWFRVTSVIIKEGRLEFVTARRFYAGWGGVDTYRAEHGAVPLLRVLGEVNIITLTNTQETHLRFNTKGDVISKVLTHYRAMENGPTRDAPTPRLDGEPVSYLKNPVAELQQRVKAGMGARTTASEFSIPVATDEAERFKKAFDHLIKLNGGGGKDLF